MKRIGVISDTHGAVSVLSKCIRAAGRVDGWFHLGDIASDAEYLSEMTGLPVFSVLGNCDGCRFQETEENIFPEPQRRVTSEMVVTVERARIFLCHGHLYDVDMGVWTLSYRAEELVCQAALYGHTHRGDLSAYGGVMILNPGSPSRPRGGAKPSFAVLEVDGRDVNARIITI